MDVISSWCRPYKIIVYHQDLSITLRAMLVNYIEDLWTQDSGQLLSAELGGTFCAPYLCWNCVKNRTEWLFGFYF
jgi:hypothetical protein